MSDHANISMDTIEGLVFEINSAESFMLRVVSVDPDNIRDYGEKEEIKVNLHEDSAPHNWFEHQESVTEDLKGQMVRVTVIARDNYGRIIGNYHTIEWNNA